MLRNHSWPPHPHPARAHLLLPRFQSFVNQSSFREGGLLWSHGKGSGPPPDEIEGAGMSRADEACGAGSMLASEVCASGVEVNSTLMLAVGVCCSMGDSSGYVGVRRIFAAWTGTAGRKGRSRHWPSRQPRGSPAGRLSRRRCCRGEYDASPTRGEHAVACWSSGGGWGTATATPAN